MPDPQRMAAKPASSTSAINALFAPAAQVTAFATFTHCRVADSNHLHAVICLQQCGRDIVRGQGAIARCCVGITLADRIRLARRLTGLSQSGASRLLEVHRGTFGHWERGAGHRPTSANLLRLAEAFNVSYEWLATGRGTMAQAGANEPAAAERPVVHDEEQLLHLFRCLSVQRRYAVVRFVRSQVAYRVT